MRHAVSGHSPHRHVRDDVIAADVVVYVLVTSGRVRVDCRRSLECVRKYLRSVHLLRKPHSEHVCQRASPALSGEPVSSIAVSGKRRNVIHDLVYSSGISIVLSGSLSIRSVHREVLLPDLVAEMPVGVYTLHDYSHKSRIAEALLCPGVIAIFRISTCKVTVADLFKADTLKESCARIVVLIAHARGDQLHRGKRQFLVLSRRIIREPVVGIIVCVLDHHIRVRRFFLVCGHPLDIAEDVFVGLSAARQHERAKCHQYSQRQSCYSSKCISFHDVSLPKRSLWIMRLYHIKKAADESAAFRLCKFYSPSLAICSTDKQIPRPRSVQARISTEPAHLSGRCQRLLYSMPSPRR